MRNNNRKGFTLIELLIVIAIIGILAAVLIPNLLSARTRAFDTAAQSCARSIATAQEIVAIDSATSAYGDWAAVDATGSVDNCDGMDGDFDTAAATAANYAAAAAGWTVQHPNGNAAFNVRAGEIRSVARQ